MRALNLSGLLGKVLLISALVGLPGPLLHAQEIQIKVLNGRDGKPITNECVNVWIGTVYGAHLVAATNKDGVVVLHVEGRELVADAACPGWPVRASGPTVVNAITVAGDKYVACQEYGKFAPGERPTTNSLKDMIPSYPVKEIVDSGLSAANTCGKARATAKPGELVFFERPRGFWEKMWE